MNVTLFISIILNLPDGKNITTTSLVDNKNVSVINVFIDANNVSNIHLLNYTNIAEDNAYGYKNASEVTRFHGENASVATTSDYKKIYKVTDDENASEMTVYDSEKIRSLSDQLYSNIVSGKYEDAVSMSMGFDDREVVTKTVKNLIDTNANNTMNYAYRLWTAGGKDIVTESFPPEFKAILNGDPLTIISKDCGSILSVSAEFEEQKKTKLAFRGKVRTSWKMIPIWENDNSPVLYFKIKNIDTNFFLYVSWLNLGDDLRGVWAYKDAYTEDHQWYIKPEAKNVFKIINRKYAGSLSFNNLFSVSAREGWVWVTGEDFCKKQGDDACSWSYTWLIEPLL